MKIRKLLVEMIIIVSFVIAFGAWTLNEWYKRYPITGTLDEMHMSKSTRFTHNFSPVKQAKVYQGKWHRNYLEVMK